MVVLLIKKFHKPLLIGLFALGIFFRFYNLTWGAPFYFHPDERNTAFAISSLSFPQQMNPHFFAYGSFPLYTIYIVSNVVSIFSHKTAFSVPFEQAIVSSRFLSAVFSLLLLPSLFFIGKNMYEKTVGVTAFLLGIFSIGFIQFAHFGTFEIWTAFFSLWFFYFCYSFAKQGGKGKLILAGVFFALLIGIKISNLVLIIPLLFSIFYRFFKEKKKPGLPFSSSSLLITSTFLIFFITNPFVFFDFNSFWQSISYESSVAQGTLPVFYTQTFWQTTSIFYQLFSIYPFLLNPLIEVLFLIASVFVIKRFIKTKELALFFLLLFFFLLFFSQTILFVKWTRYMVPTLPFVYLLIAIFLTKLSKKYRFWGNTLLFAAITTSTLFSFSYVKTVFITPDTRIQAATFAKTQIKKGSLTLSEPYDLGTMPFPNLLFYNFYNLDTTQEKQVLTTLLSNTDYILLPSQRLWKVRLLGKNHFPSGYLFYHSLFDGTLGFEKVYQTPCDAWCLITYLGNPIYSFEETASVFDRPTVTIFKKTKPYNQMYYETILTKK